ncbi:MAG: Zn-dependent hydrolase [Gammaproteobacteria bacterium]|nr:Zn-dependent hydrolase [Gammaproteobacteria bacterium]
MADINTIRSNPDRLWASIMEIGEIGATPKGGVGRLALTELDRQARELFISWCEQADCEVRVDQIGNIIARRAGAEPDAPPVMTGSHLDTQPLGGKFDGIYGVLAGLEVVRTLNDAGIKTRAPVETVVWTDEEGVRFSGTLASGAFAGVYKLEEALAKTDREGITFGDALKETGLAGSAPVGGYDLNAFFEAHIEQGPILEAEGKQVGVVLGAQGQKCFVVTVTGEEGHAGTLPMRMRRDAMVGAAKMVDAINAIAFKHQPIPVITVGHLSVRPNSRNTIPGQVTFTIDSRHPDDALLAQVEEEMRVACGEIASSLSLELEFRLDSQRGTVTFHDECVDLIRDTAKRLGIDHMDIYSGAGHDACQLVRKAPTGMIFVPCEKGISHNELENAKAEDLAAGCDVLLHAMLARASVANA